MKASNRMHSDADKTGARLMWDSSFMKVKVRIKILLAVIALLSVSQRANASWVELCEIRGVVESTTAVSELTHAVALLLRVNAVKAEKLGHIESYTDCNEHLGQRLTIHLSSLQYRKRTIQTGDTLVVFRTVVDDSQGRSHIKIETREHLPRQTPAQ